MNPDLIWLTIYVYEISGSEVNSYPCCLNRLIKVLKVQKEKALTCASCEKKNSPCKMPEKKSDNLYHHHHHHHHHHHYYYYYYYYYQYHYHHYHYYHYYYLLLLLRLLLLLFFLSFFIDTCLLFVHIIKGGAEPNSFHHFLKVAFG